MTKPRRTLSAGIAIMLLGISARAEIEFVGILATSETTRFALHDTVTAETKWVTRGDQFSGYDIKAYDAKRDVLTIVRDGTERRIRLKDDGKVQPSRLELSGSIMLGGTSKVKIERATLVLGEENVFPLSDGVTYRITPERLENGNYVYGIGIERAIADNKVERISSPRVTTLAGQPFSLLVGDFEFTFSPIMP